MCVCERACVRACVRVCNKKTGGSVGYINNSVHIIFTKWTKFVTSEHVLHAQTGMAVRLE